MHKIALLLILGFSAVSADEIRVAVASNFSQALTAIAARFMQKTGHKIVLSTGATGRHYAQIKNGAPFVAFFAADTRRPEMLEKAGAARLGSRFTYAIGKVILWSPTPGLVKPGCAALKNSKFRHLAIANPKLAPYGKAAWEVLQTCGLWDSWQAKIVRGENIGQTFQFVHSGNAELGFVAYSQLKQPRQVISGSWWEVPPELYSPIAQQAVLLQDNVVAKQFLLFMRQGEVLKLIRDFGYDVL